MVNFRKETTSWRRKFSAMTFRACMLQLSTWPSSSARSVASVYVLQPSRLVNRGMLLQVLWSKLLLSLHPQLAGRALHILQLGKHTVILLPVRSLYVLGWNELGPLLTPRAQDVKQTSPFFPSFGIIYHNSNNLVQEFNVVPILTCYYCPWIFSRLVLHFYL